MIPLTVLAETKTTLTVGWTPLRNATGYEFLVDSVRVSNTFDPTRSSVKFGKPSSGEHIYSVVALGKLDEGDLTWPAVTPPVGWVVAPPAPPPVGTVITNPVGAGVNVYQAPAHIVDTVVNGGQDQAFLVQGGQGGGAGSTFERIQGNLVGGYSVPHNNKHFFYVKGANVTALDASATAALSPNRGDGGFSVRYAGFRAERFKLIGFQLPLCIFADDLVKGPVLFKDGIVDVQPGQPVFYGSTDEAATLNYDVELDNVAATGPDGNPFWNFDTGTFLGTLKVHATCTYNGVPITKASQGRNCPAGQLRLVA